MPAPVKHSGQRAIAIAIAIAERSPDCAGLGVLAAALADSCRRAGSERGTALNWRLPGGTHAHGTFAEAWIRKSLFRRLMTPYTSTVTIS